MDRFNKIDGDNFGPCMRQLYSKENKTCLEWRMTIKDADLCIIQFHENGNGYSIFKQQE